MSKSVDQEQETMETDNSTVKEMMTEMLKRQDEIFESLTTRIGKIESEQQRLKILEGHLDPSEDDNQQYYTPKKKDTDRRSSLATRDLGKLLEKGQELQVIHTPQSFRLNGKLGDTLGLREYRVTQIHLLAGIAFLYEICNCGLRHFHFRKCVP